MGGGMKSGLMDLVLLLVSGRYMVWICRLGQHVIWG